MKMTMLFVRIFKLEIFVSKNKVSKFDKSESESNISFYKYCYINILIINIENLMIEMKHTKKCILWKRSETFIV